MSDATKVSVLRTLLERVQSRARREAGEPVASSTFARAPEAPRVSAPTLASLQGAAQEALTPPPAQVAPAPPPAPPRPPTATATPLPRLTPPPRPAPISRVDPPAPIVEPSPAPPPVARVEPPPAPAPIAPVAPPPAPIAPIEPSPAPAPVAAAQPPSPSPFDALAMQEPEEMAVELIEVGPASDPPAAGELSFADVLEDLPRPPPEARRDDDAAAQPSLEEAAPISLAPPPPAPTPSPAGPTDAQLGALIELADAPDVDLSLDVDTRVTAPAIELGELATEAPTAGSALGAPAIAELRLPSDAPPAPASVVAAGEPVEVAAVVVERNVVRGAGVAAFVGAARTPSAASFGELLDASLELGA